MDSDRTARSTRNMLSGMWAVTGIAAVTLAVVAARADDREGWWTLALVAILAALAGSAVAARRDHVRLALAVASLPLLAGGVLLGLFDLLLYGFRCWDSCGSAGGGWRYDAHAWQWSLIAVCGVAGLVGVLAASGLAIARRPRAALVAYGAAATMYLVPLVMTFSRWLS